eukprot:gene1893-3668_t
MRSRTSSPFGRCSLNLVLFSLLLGLCIMLVLFSSFSHLSSNDDHIRDNYWVRNGEGRGIVMCSSEKMMKSTIDAIAHVRNDWKSSLPFVIMHCNELTKSSSKKFQSISEVSVYNICQRDFSAAFEKKLRSFFCKAAALYMSPFEESMLLDVDVLWFNKPDYLFDAPGYISTGALFFRDRFVYQTALGQKRDGLFQREVEQLIEHEGQESISLNRASQLSRRSYISFFWRNAVNRSAPALQHIQESSVVLMRKSNHLKTLSVIHRLLPSYQQGYGDKEIYWIAATIAKENFSFEPFLFGVYGDCGAMMHFDPRQENNPNASVFFINAEYLLERIKSPGDMMQPIMSRPVPITKKTAVFDMGTVAKVTKGRCGACKYMGCMEVPPYVNDTIIRMQKRRIALMS